MDLVLVVKVKSWGEGKIEGDSTRQYMQKRSTVDIEPMIFMALLMLLLHLNLINSHAYVFTSLPWHWHLRFHLPKCQIRQSEPEPSTIAKRLEQNVEGLMYVNDRVGLISSCFQLYLLRIKLLLTTLQNALNF